jgi:hypothetical protein
LPCVSVHAGRGGRILGLPELLIDETLGLSLCGLTVCQAWLPITANGSPLIFGFSSSFEYPA